MRIIETIEEMRRWSESERCQQRRIAFIPTMGFLHQGHLSLVRDGRKRGDRVVVSIFVNPAQFAPREDFAAYPRDFDRDRDLLEKEAVHALFHPSMAEMYPEGFQTRVEVEKLGGVLCGAFRPGHFLGVATVVAKLFNIVQPQVAIFGQKDFQQLQVIRRMVGDLGFAVEIVGHPTVREPDGLAMSSRNAYLDVVERRAALCLWRSLGEAEDLIVKGERRAAVILDRVRAKIATEPLARLEYARLCDAKTLSDVDEARDECVIALAVWIGKARLIDNRVFHPDP